MKGKSEHIKHKRINSKDCSFYICNVFEITANKIELYDIIELDLLNEKYFQTEEQLKQIIENGKAYFPNNVDKSESIIIDPYGPIIRSEINIKDFEKLNYQSYKSKIEFIIENLGKIENGNENDLKTFDLETLNELKEFNLEKIDYYFLDSELIEKKRKHEFGYWYSYFYTVVGINKESNNLFILNYGND